MVVTDYKTDFKADAQMLSFAESLRSAPGSKVSDDFTSRIMNEIRSESKASPLHPVWTKFFTPGKAFAAAASVIILLGISSVFLRTDESSVTGELLARQCKNGQFTSSSAAPYVQAFAIRELAKNPAGNAVALKAAVNALLASQNADGSWLNDQVTACNVTVLAAVAELGIDGVSHAYKMGARYLRTRNIALLTKEEMNAEAKKALAFICAS